MNTYIARTYAGLEKVLAAEIEDIGGRDVTPGRRMVQFSGSPKTMYRSNYELRTAIRILQPIRSFIIKDAQDVYKEALKVRWDRFFAPEQSFKINKVVFSDFFPNTNYAALLLKDGLVDYFRQQYDSRPSVDKKAPDVVVDLHIQQNSCDISIDMSGESLHLRGYKTKQTYAPLSEVLAAGMVIIAKSERYQQFINPMCGSGTIAIEAAHYFSKIPAQVSRKHFGFFNHKSFDEEQWQLVVKGAKMRALRQTPQSVSAYDWSDNAIQATRANLHKAGCYRDVSLRRSNFFYEDPPAGRAVVILNPPYDKRLTLKDSKSFYLKLGQRLKQAYKGKDVWIISPAIEEMKRIGLKHKKSIALNNGPIKCVFNKYEVY